MAIYPIVTPYHTPGRSCAFDIFNCRFSQLHANREKGMDKTMTSLRQSAFGLTHLPVTAAYGCGGNFFSDNPPGSAVTESYEGVPKNTLPLRASTPGCNIINQSYAGCTPAAKKGELIWK
jgi:hypothetical protein